MEKKLIAELSGENYSNSVKLTMIEESGLRKKKIIDMQEFVDAVNDSLRTRKTGKFRRIGGIPQGLYDLSVNDSYENSFSCILDVPGRERLLVYTKGKEGRKAACIYVPHLVFFF